MTSGYRGPPYFRGYNRELVLKPAISLKKMWGGATVDRLVGIGLATQTAVPTILATSYEDSVVNSAEIIMLRA